MNGSSEGAPSAGNMAAACSQQGGSVIDLPVQRIEQVVQPTAQQQSAFDGLKKAAQKAGDQLQIVLSNRGAEIASGAGRYGRKRLSAMADAIKSVRPCLNNFYASLSDEQKARFTPSRLLPNATSSPQQHRSGGQ